MARLGITLEQVTAAADAILGEGKQPTVRAIRERLGNTGSPNTIHRHLSTWREARPMASATATALSPGLAGAIAGEIERAAAAARGEIEERLVQAQQEATELASAGEVLEAERDALLEQVVALTKERDTLAGQVTQQALALETAQQQISREQHAAEAARIELATALVRAEQQQKTEATQSAEIERLRPLLEVAQKATISAEQQAAVLQAKLEAAIERASRAEAGIAQSEQEAHQAIQYQHEAREQAAHLRGQLEAIQHSSPAPTRGKGKHAATPSNSGPVQESLDVSSS
jgi:DNA repair exonuclease SbcCD ATPase subunit